MRSLQMREILPPRRRTWTQHVHIDGQTVYLCVGEYDDGRPGEIFVDVSKQGTFLRGVMTSLARMVSISLQCGADISVVVHALKGSDYPPAGPVNGSCDVKECLSVTDWIARELEAVYMPDTPTDTNVLADTPLIEEILPMEDDEDEDEEEEDEFGSLVEKSVGLDVDKRGSGW